LNGTAEEEELLGEGGFTGIGVADNPEGAAAFYLLLVWPIFIRFL